METQTLNRERIQTCALGLSLYKNYNLSNFTVEEIKAALPIAKRYLTRDIKNQQVHVQEVIDCAAKPIDYGRLKGTGFFWIHGDIRSQHWARMQQEDLKAMINRREHLDKLNFLEPGVIEEKKKGQDVKRITKTLDVYEVTLHRGKERTIYLVFDDIKQARENYNNIFFNIKF